MAGSVFAGERKIGKPGDQLEPATVLTLKTGTEYVSRGAHKLLHGLEHFAVDAKDLVAIDVGASTGGFTDVLLKAGAAKIYAVDVGYGQLHWSLRQDPKVVVLERTNARYLTRAEIPKPVDLLVCDASFISLTKVLPAAMELAGEQAQLLALIKPQFEAGRAEIGKGGVVRDAAVHRQVCETIVSWLTECGWQVAGVTESPIKGPKGNIEFLVYARKR